MTHRLSIRWGATMALIALTLAATAKPVDQSAAAATARQLLAGHSRLRTASPTTADVKLIYKPTQKRSASVSSGTTATEYYVFAPAGERDAFVIVSGDDEMRPVVGYAFDTPFDPANLPPQLAAYLEDYADAVSAVRSGSATAATEPATGEAVEPFLNVKWGQRTPYDLYTIPYPTGCVATAMAQVMKYYEYPPKGQGVTDANNLLSELDLGTSVYDWANMLPEYEDGRYTDTQGAAVALLMRDAGAALQMNYEEDGSGASSYHVAPSMIRHFGYSKEMRYLEREHHSTIRWMEIIRDNLTQSRPIIYSGRGGNDGHAFVLDGIDADGFVHVNWGWRGACNGYFDINVLAPEELGTGGGSGHYHHTHAMTVDILPGDPGADMSDYKYSLYLRDAAPKWTQTDADGMITGDSPMQFTLALTVINNTRREANGVTIYAGLYDAEKQTVKSDFATCQVYRLLPERISDFEMQLDFTGIANGDYFLRPWYTQSGENREFDFSHDEQYMPVSIRGGRVYLPVAEPEPAEPYTFISFSQDGVIYDGTREYTAKVTFSNSSSSIMYSPSSFRLYCMPAAQAVDNPDISQCTSLGYPADGTLYDGATTTFAAKLYLADANLSAGRYRMYAFYDDKPIPEAAPQYLEITPLPDLPFILTSPLSSWRDEYANTTNEWMSLDINYRSIPGWQDWYGGVILVQAWACPEGATEADEFLLFEASTSSMPYNDDVFYANAATAVYATPKVLWRTPGRYDCYIKCRPVRGDYDWIRPEGDNNHLTLQIVKPEPEFALDMVAPMEINGGNPVVAGEEFDIKVRVASPTGIRFDTDPAHSKILISDDPYRSASIAADIRSVTFSASELQPGEEATVAVHLRIPDYSDYYGQRYTVYMELRVATGNTDDNVTAVPYPGEYVESTTLEVTDPAAGIDTIGTDASDGTVQYFNLQGMPVDGSNLAPGIYIRRSGSGTDKVLIRHGK